MRHASLLLLLLIILAPTAGAQKISHTYNNVSLSEALLQMQNGQEEYTVNFVYNELEDFLVTTAVQNKTLPEAILQIIGFYPVRMTVKEGDRVANVDGVPVYAQTDGKIRGLLQDGVPVTKGLKSGDVDPRGTASDHLTVSDKALSIGGGVLEAILSYAGDRL